MGGAEGKVVYIGRSSEKSVYLITHLYRHRGNFPSRENPANRRALWRYVNYSGFENQINSYQSTRTKLSITSPTPVVPTVRQVHSSICFVTIRLTHHLKHQYELLDSLSTSLATNEYRLLVIDSVMALFRTDYVGRGELSERQQALGQYLRRLTQMAEEFNLVVLLVSGLGD